MSSIALVGAGGHGKVVAEIAELNGYNKIVFFDDKYPQLEKVGSWPIEGLIKNLKHRSKDFNEVMVTIGDNLTRANFADEFGGIAKMAKLIHPSAVVSRSANILPGTVVMAKAVVNPYATVEANVIVNTSAVIDHDCIVHEASHISPGAILAGNVTVGSKSWVGLGAKLLEGVTIGDGVIVGAGSVVTGNFPDGVLLTGVPARVKRQI